MIIWLASYPKSGNTWVRLFLNSLFYSKNEIDINNVKIQQFPNKKYFKNILKKFSNVETIINNCLDAQYAINLDSRIKFLKTHSSCWRTDKTTFTNFENTLGVIHIVRDPRNVITSLKNHYNKKSYENTLKFMKDKKKFIGSKNFEEEFDIPTLISSWSNHYKSWSKFDKNYLLVKYEDLIKDSKNEFMKITNYVKKISNLELNADLDKIVDNCSFENLRSQENQKGFIEAAKNRKFFFLGPRNNWKDVLDKKTQQDIEASFYNEMKELNYL